MEIKNAQKQALELLQKVNKKNNVIHEPSSMFLHLVEEIGEVSRELQNKQENWRFEFDKEKLGDELSDVMSDLFIIAEDNDIDLDSTFQNKLIKTKLRFNL